MPVLTMFISYGVAVFLFPPFNLIWIALLLGITFASVYAGRKLIRIGRADIAHPTGKLTSLALPLWGLSTAALAASFIVIVAVSMAWPWLGVVHSEWGIAHEQAWAQAAVYLGGWSLLYFALQLAITHRLFSKRIIDQDKRRRLYLLHAGTAALLWELLTNAAVLL